jgi:hypothetical protein
MVKAGSLYPQMTMFTKYLINGATPLILTCPDCGFTFHGETCRSCHGLIKAYLCPNGHRVPNPVWSGRQEHTLIRKVHLDGSLS